LDFAEGYDPLELASRVERLVAVEEGGVVKRWYWRFRGGRWYGGIATGDLVGCCLRCGFCWAWRYAWSTRGRYLLSPEEAGSRLVSIARSRRYRQVRLSGGEPTIAPNHFLEVARYCLSRGLHFVLETNGVLLGARYDLARRVAELRGVGGGIEVRVSIKGCSPREFRVLTGAREDAWLLQLEALRNLLKLGLEPCEEVYPAIMLSFCDRESEESVVERLRDIDEALARCIDPEYVFLYPHVIELMRRRGLRPRTAYRPSEIPDNLI